jgi:hypothetical protein
MVRFLRGLFVAVAAVLVVGSVSCSTSGSSADSGPKKVTYHCLMSSCDATVVCNEGDPVPQHCGKPMIR